MAQLPAQDLTAWLWLAGAGAFLLLLIVWPRRGRRIDDDVDGRTARRGSLAQERAVEHDLQALTREVAEMVRRAAAQLDAKSARLEQLVRDADERIAHLQALERDGSGSGSSSSAGAAGNGHLARPALPPAIHLSVPPPASAPSGEAAAEARHAQIYALQDQGYSPRQIADSLGRPTGEVELILALRPRPRGAEPAPTAEPVRDRTVDSAPEPEAAHAEPLN